MKSLVSPTQQPDDLADLPSSTKPIWVLALYPLPYSLVVVVILSFLGLAGGLVVDVFALGALFLIWGMAIWDHSVLERRGIPAPSVLWMFLSPIGYLVARRVKLRKVGIRADAPGNVFAIGFVAGIALSLLTAWPISQAIRDQSAVTALQVELQTQLSQRTSTPWTVSCPSDAPASRTGAYFLCQASDTGGRAATFKAVVVSPDRFTVSVIASQTGSSNS